MPNSEKALYSRINGAAMGNMFIYAFSVNILPVALVDIKGELGLTLTQAGLLNSLTSILQMIMLFASVFAAAKWGKLRILQLSLIISAFGLFLISRSMGFLMLLSAVLVMGFGNTFMEALLTPLVEDLYPGDTGEKMNRLHAFWPLGVTTSVLLVGELLSRGISWRWVFLGAALPFLALVLFYPSPKRISLPRSIGDFSHIREILRSPLFWVMGFCLFFAGGAEGGYAFWIASYIQLQFGALPRAGALGAALFAVGMILGRTLSSRLAPRWGLPAILIASAGCGLVFSVFFFGIGSLWSVYLFSTLAGFSIASLWPSIQTRTARIVPQDPTAIMVLISMFGIPGYASATQLMGILGDRKGLGYSFVVVIAYLIMLLLLLFLSLSMVKKSQASTK